MSSLEPVISLLSDPSARVLFVLDTSGSALGSGMHEQAFSYLDFVRREHDPEGKRTVAITDNFGRAGQPAIEPKPLRLDARSSQDIPPEQVNGMGGGSQHPLERVGNTQLFKDYAPTHLVFIGDLMDTPPSAEDLPVSSDKVLFLLWGATPKSVVRERRYYKDSGAVEPLFLPGELEYLNACEEAKLLAGNAQPIAPTRKHRM